MNFLGALLFACGVNFLIGGIKQSRNASTSSLFMLLCARAKNRVSP
jgi:hypothetical protein